MPAKFDPSLFFEGAITKDKGIIESRVFMEYVECQNCKNKILVKPEWIDYKELYYRQCEINKQMQSLYSEVFREANRNFPGFEKWIDEEMLRLRDHIRNTIKNILLGGL